MKGMFRPLILAPFIFLASCGGGGGGSSGQAVVNVSAEPSKLDAGDITTVSIEVYDVQDGGVVLKIRTPVGLDYVNDSGFLAVDGVSLNLDPDFYKTDDTYNYLVYFLGRNLFGEDNFGLLTVNYQGTGAVAAGTIDVDADANDPSVPDSSEFSADAPNFSAQDSQKVVVKN